MKRKHFFRNAASKALTLVAAVMMSAAFAACSSSNDEPTPPPSPKAGTVTVDGKEKPILEARYINKGDDNYELYLRLNNDGGEGMYIELNEGLHINSITNLTKKEAKHDRKLYWKVSYFSGGTTLINTCGDPDEPLLFTTGTLDISGSLKGNINIRLENGRLKDEDGNEHTLTISYSGEMEKIEQFNGVFINNDTKPILKAEYDNRGDGDYSLYLYLSDDRKERVEFQLNKDLHMSGNPVDLTEKEKKHTGKCYWAVGYYKPDDTIFIDTHGDPDEPKYPVFTTGGFTAAGSPEGNIDIFIDGTVTGTDGNVYELRIIYNGPMTQKK